MSYAGASVNNDICSSHEFLKTSLQGLLGTRVRMMSWPDSFMRA